MDHLFDIFMTASNMQFCNYVQNLKDFHCLRTNTPEALFLQVQDYYNNIITKPGAVWLKMKKTKAVLTAGTPTTQPKSAGGNQASQQSTATAPSNQGMQADNGSGWRTPRPVDHTKPKEGEHHTQVNDHGWEEHWCSKCPNDGRWGNHLTDGHAKWLKSFLEYKAKQKQKAEQNGLEQPSNSANDNNQESAKQGEVSSCVNVTTVQAASIQVHTVHPVKTKSPHVSAIHLAFLFDKWKESLDE